MDYSFKAPQKGVFVPGDIEKWEKSEAYQDIIGFLSAMNESVKAKKLSCECVESAVTVSLLQLLDTLSGWVDEIPPIDQPQRFGNKAFKDFYNRLKENCETKLRELLPSDFHSSLIEITPYMVESFGNSTRIDYGTGHELSFIMFLCCLHKIGALSKDDSVATVTRIFKKYIDLSRKLQVVYKMEPAGSQGVWSLDDFQFIPFLWGSSQLIMHPKISPEMFTIEKVIQENANEYMFLGCVKHITSVKTGPFAEHSNQLWNISGVKSWTKINQGLLKMYKAEILHKFPVIQHCLFGSVLSMDPAKDIRFHPSLDMGPMKASLAMMSRGHPGSDMGPGMMPIATGMPPSNEMKAPETGRFPSFPKPVSSACAVMGLRGVGRMSPGAGVMPFATKGTVNMPPVSQQVPNAVPVGYVSQMPPPPATRKKEECRKSDDGIVK